MFSLVRQWNLLRFYIDKYCIDIICFDVWVKTTFTTWHCCHLKFANLILLFHSCMVTAFHIFLIIDDFCSVAFLLYNNCFQCIVSYICCNSVIPVCYSRFNVTTLFINFTLSCWSFLLLFLLWVCHGFIVILKKCAMIFNAII